MSPQLTNMSMTRHIHDFVNLSLEDLLKRMSRQVVLHTPLGKLRGHGGLKKFHSVLQEYIPKARLEVHAATALNDILIYKWRAFSPTAVITDGQCKVLFKGKEIIEQWIECSVQPFVQNQG